MRGRIALYKDPEAFDALAAADAVNNMEDSEDEGAKDLDIPLDELLEDLQFLGMAEENPDADDIAGILGGMDVE